MLSAVHVGGMLLLLVLPVAWWIRLVLGLLLGWSLYRALWMHAWRRGVSAIEAIELDEAGDMSVRLVGEDTWHRCQIRSRFVHPQLTLLSLKMDVLRRPVSLAIAADAVEAEPFRRWRVALRLRVIPA